MIKRALGSLLAEKLIPAYAHLPKALHSFFMFIVEMLYIGSWRAMYYKPVLKRQKIGNASFLLWIAGQNPSAQMSYDDIEAEQKKEPYESLMVECLTCILPALKDPVFIDIGAFMGYYACYVSRYLKDEVPVYAIESNPDYCNCIRKSKQENKFENLKVLEAVLSDREELLSVYKETVSADNDRGRKKRAVTLDRLCQGENIKPNILKIDVHGAEGKVIGGARGILKEELRFILFELHPEDYLKKYSPGYDRDKILSMLEECNFRNFLIGGFRYSRSPEREIFRKTGKIPYIEITPENKKDLFFDRHVDIFILSVRDFDISRLKCF